ncbi:hypothetical protein L3Q82_012791, partial [Scortum barcoo]
MRLTVDTIMKFADDTTIVGLISDNDETHYREEIQHLTQWCSNNNLVLNTSKTKEVIVDYRRKLKRAGLSPQLLTNFYRATIERASSASVQQCGMAAAQDRKGLSPGGENSTGDCGKSSSRPGLNIRWPDAEEGPTYCLRPDPPGKWTVCTASIASGK